MPSTRAASTHDRSSRSHSCKASRVAGFNRSNSEESSWFCSFCKYVASGLGRESGKSREISGVSSVDSSAMAISRDRHACRRHINVSFLAILINQVQKEDLPAKLDKFTKAFISAC